MRPASRSQSCGGMEEEGPCLGRSKGLCSQDIANAEYVMAYL